MSAETRQVLHDHEFQNFMADSRLMVREPIPAGGLDLIPNKTHQPPSPTGARFLGRLSDDEGFVVPYEDITESLYGLVDKANVLAASKWSHEVRRKMQHPEYFKKFPLIGYSLGVNDFKLTPRGLSIIYNLWQKMWDEVSLGELTAIRPSSTLETVRDLRRIVLPTTNVRIDHNHHDKKSYFRLHYEDDLGDQSKAEDYVSPSHLSFDFQDWLGSEHIGLLKRKMPGPAVTPLIAAGFNFGRIEQNTVDLLNKYYGYILPYDFIASKVYGETNGNSKDRIGAVFTKIKGKIINPESIIGKRQMGYGCGVESFDLSVFELKFLNTLWQNLGGSVGVGDIAEQVYGEANPKSELYIQRVASGVRDKLGNSGIKIAAKFASQDNPLSYGIRSK